MTESTQTRMRPIRSFVLREGRLTSAQRRALEELLPRYGIEPGDGALDFAAIFGRKAPVWLEIGFGNGDALHYMALRHPEIDFVGIEVHRPGVGHLLQAVEDDGLTNVRVIRADAAEILHNNIADASLARVLIFFPDPWPKKRHHKRRLVQPPFVREIARVLEPDGILHLATDWRDYAEHMETVLDAEDTFARVASTDTSYRPRTRFEQRGENKGHEVCDLLYRKAGGTTDEQGRSKGLGPRA